MNTCPQCGNTFECRANACQEEPCWCTQLPMLPPDAYVMNKDKAGSCFCPACLRTLLDKTTVTPQ